MHVAIPQNRPRSAFQPDAGFVTGCRWWTINRPIGFFEHALLLRFRTLFRFSSPTTKSPNREPATFSNALLESCSFIPIKYSSQRKESVDLSKSRQKNSFLFMTTGSGHSSGAICIRTVIPNSRGWPLPQNHWKQWSIEGNSAIILCFLYYEQMPITWIPEVHWVWQAIKMEATIQAPSDKIVKQIDKI